MTIEEAKKVKKNEEKLARKRKSKKIFEKRVENEESIYDHEYEPNRDRRWRIFACK